VTTLVVKLGTTGILSNSVVDHGKLQLLRGTDGIHISLPSENPGRLELLAPDGRLLDSRSVPGGTKEFKLGTPARSGLMVVKLVQGNASWSTDFVNP
jgi:hypothetical protein